MNTVSAQYNEIGACSIFFSLVDKPNRPCGIVLNVDVFNL